MEKGNEFIYLFSEADRDAFLAKGFVLLKSDDVNKMYVFKNTDDIWFDCKKTDCVLSNVITF